MKLSALRSAKVDSHEELPRVASRFVDGALGSMRYLTERDLCCLLFEHGRARDCTRAVVKVILHTPVVDTRAPDVTCVGVTGISEQTELCGIPCTRSSATAGGDDDALTNLARLLSLSRRLALLSNYFPYLGV